MAISYFYENRVLWLQRRWEWPSNLKCERFLSPFDLFWRRKYRIFASSAEITRLQMRSNGDRKRSHLKRTKETSFHVFSLTCSAYTRICFIVTVCDYYFAYLKKFLLPFLLFLLNLGFTGQVQYNSNQKIEIKGRTTIKKIVENASNWDVFGREFSTSFGILLPPLWIATICLLNQDYERCLLKNLNAISQLLRIHDAVRTLSWKLLWEREKKKKSTIHKRSHKNVKPDFLVFMKKIRVVGYLGQLFHAE